MGQRTFAVMVIAILLWMLARHGRSRLLAVIALTYTAAVMVADWPALAAAPSALTAGDRDPLRALAFIGSPVQPAQIAMLLPALVLLAAATVSFALPPRLSGGREAN